MPAQLARTKHDFLLNRQGQAVNTRDPPDFQELLITLCTHMAMATQRGVRPGREKGRRMGWEKHLKKAVMSVFLSWAGWQEFVTREIISQASRCIQNKEQWTT